MDLPCSPHISVPTLEATQQRRYIANKWALSWIVFNNNGQNVANVIQQGTAYGISDGLMIEVPLPFWRLWQNKPNHGR
jgi:hypothetical protein